MKLFLTVLMGLFLLAELPAVSADVEKPPPQANILFAIADDWSHGHTSVEGTKWIDTPGFDRVAKSGVRFTNAFTPNAKCCPSRSILLTGRYSWQLEDAANHICFFPPKFKIYTEALSESGYFVAYTGKGWGPGVAKTADGEPRPMTGRGFNSRKAKSPARGISGNDYAGNFGVLVKQGVSGIGSKSSFVGQGDWIPAGGETTYEFGLDADSSVEPGILVKVTVQVAVLDTQHGGFRNCPNVHVVRFEWPLE